MPDSPTSFVILAGMRTGSNLLEASLNLLADVTCHGEAFNPAMIGYPRKAELLGITREARDDDPLQLLGAIRKATGLNGFRYFSDHDPRVFDAFMQDRSCAKVVLTRNPVESYVSLSIARQTGQWKLGDARTRKSGKARFDADDFTAYLQEAQGFQLQIMHALQISGQTAFYIDYDDLRDRTVLDGLTRFLGRPQGIPDQSVGIVPQNPEPIEEKVENFPEMEQALAGLDRFNLSRSPNFEPRRGPGVPRYIGADRAGLLFMPISSGPDQAVLDWLAALGPDNLSQGFTQKTLRDWLRARPRHHRIAILRHPLARAHVAFQDKILANRFADLRALLVSKYKLPLPQPGKEAQIDARAYRAALLAFLRFLKANLAGQTAIRVDMAWASQIEILQGLALFTPPDLILRESEAGPVLQRLAHEAAIANAPAFDAGDMGAGGAFALADIYDDELETAAREAYARDYLLLGFGNWQP